MDLGNGAFELADRLAERERRAGIERARAALAAGQAAARLVCDCGEPISEARRRAVPHTDKCVDCATFAERGLRRAG